MNNKEAFEILLEHYCEGVPRGWCKQDIENFVDVCDFLMDEYNIDPDYFSEDVRSMISDKRMDSYGAN